MNQDLFAFGLGYLPNENIDQMEWGHKGQDKQHYAYDYDALNRLKTATHSSGNYNMAASYDKNGNIENLSRKGYLGGSFGNMDVLGYNYTGSQLTVIFQTLTLNKKR